MGSPGLEQVRAVVTRLLQVEKGSLTAAEQRQIEHIRAVAGPITMLAIEVSAEAPL
jgi:hypothetical protein